MLVDKGIISFSLGALIWSLFNCIMLIILYIKARKDINMNIEEKLLCDLVDYMEYLETNKKYYSWNKGYFKKLKKKLKDFCKEYTKNHLNWY